MPPRIFDIDGTERDAAWLAATWDGCEVLPARILPGNTEYWQLAAVYCTTGNAVLKAEVRRGAGMAGNQPVVMTWPNLSNPSQDIPTLPPSQHNWAQRGVVQRTEANGITGFGLGATFGPFYFCWIASGAPSDCLAKAGMKGSTNHAGPLHGVWTLQPVAPAYASLGEALRGEAQAHQALQLNPGAALQKRIFADSFVPTSAEFDVTWDSVVYVAQRAERLDTGGVRCYYCRMDHFDTVSYVAW